VRRRPRPIQRTLSREAGLCFGRNRQVWANWGLKVGGRCDTMNAR
jgi:hypothetical protein